MKQVSLLPAHGGCGLVDRVIPQEREQDFCGQMKEYKVYEISDADLDTFYRIADGTLSPLEGPMSQDEFNQVLDAEVIERNETKYAWTIPLAFPITIEEKELFSEGDTVAVKNSQGNLVGIIEITDIYPFDKKKYNQSVYGTDRGDHPGPRIVNDDPREFLMGGKLTSLTPPKCSVFEKYMMTPKESRLLFEQKGWERIVGFQTRNPLHRAHEYCLVYACEQLAKQGHFAGAVLNPLVGQTKSDDVSAQTRMHTYESLIENKLLGEGDVDEDFWKTKDYDISGQFMLMGLNIKMFYAGPKEAIMHAIYRQNHGLTDQIIGRRHADAPFDDGVQVWGDFDAQEKFSKLNGELLIKPFNIGFAAYYEELGKVGLVDECKDKGYHQISISGKEVRKTLHSGENVDERIMRPATSKILIEYYKSKGEK